MFDKKRWWFGFGLGVAIALGLLITVALSGVEGNFQNRGTNLGLLFLGGIVAYVVCAYTHFGKGVTVECDDPDFHSTHSYSHSNSCVVVLVSPFPFLGGVATGYMTIVGVAFLGFIVR